MSDAAQIATMLAVGLVTGGAAYAVARRRPQPERESGLPARQVATLVVTGIVLGLAAIGLAFVLDSPAARLAVLFVWFVGFTLALIVMMNRAR